MKKIASLLACAALCSAAMADTVQRVTVGGGQVEGFVTSIAFDGDNAVLTLEDNTTITAPIDGVAVSLAYQGVADGIGTVPADDGRSPDAVYTISGQYAGTSPEGLPKGVYIVGGKKLVVK